MSMTFISSLTASSVSTITFSSIPSTYRDLKLVYQLRFDARATANNLRLTFNGSSTSDYAWLALRGNGSTADATSGANSLEIQPGFTEGTNSTSNTFGNTSIYITNYNDSNVKSVSIDSVAETNASAVQFTYLASGYRNNTAAITSLTIAAGDSFIGSLWLYGIGTN